MDGPRHPTGWAVPHWRLAVSLSGRPAIERFDPKARPLARRCPIRNHHQPTILMQGSTTFVGVADLPKLRPTLCKHFRINIAGKLRICSIDLWAWRSVLVWASLPQVPLWCVVRPSTSSPRAAGRAGGCGGGLLLRRPKGVDGRPIDQGQQDDYFRGRKGTHGNAWARQMRQDKNG